MNWLAHLLVSPFTDFAFMRHALGACLALALGCGPLGTFLLLRRMTLSGDALAHAILPGVAVGFLLFGLSLPAMTVGGFIAGLGVVVGSGAVARATPLREDASLAALYIMSLALGVLLVSLRGSSVDLMHLLFGSILAVDDSSLLLMGAIATVSLFALALLYRPLVVECVDPGFLRVMSGRGSLVHLVFMSLVALNLVGGFQALGTLMCVGLLVLPASAARFWTVQVWSQSAAATVMALASGYVGLLVSYYREVPSGPAIVLTAGACYLLSLCFGPRGGLMAQRPARRHFKR
ncbi:ABC-type transporter, integral membrane subunit [Desulfovibrio sp. X2]|uniref:metal ABC transporter permease n=1 Tax=Desulfovibrio sp. X2 TaxID=941449 RepID=UPI000358CD4A|nr:metal ABC transporter permease [Desulfovibrio sp. X2]EPR44279.1 ABC-type transporter, integral membrane subunit [Desulfovibrio sp. X2]